MINKFFILILMASLNVMANTDGLTPLHIAAGAGDTETRCGFAKSC
jgi:hypothetical protein